MIFRIGIGLGICLLFACKNSGSDTTHAITESISGRLAFQSNRSGNFEIYLSRTSGTGLDNISENIFDNTTPSLSLDGNKVVYLSDRDTVRGMYIFQNNTTTRLLPGTASYDTPRISYAGDLIAFVNRFNIYVMTTGGSGVTAITHNGNDTANYAPAFSFDGLTIAFVRTVHQGPSDIYVMSSFGGPAENITLGIGNNTSPSFSPDGQEIVFCRGSHVCLLTLTTGNVLDLMPGDSLHVNQQPVFSPDGKRIAFTTDRSGNLDVFIMDRDGGGLTNISDNDGIDMAPAWSR